MRIILFKIIGFILCWGYVSTWLQPAFARDFTVVIDAGHGGHDAGAVGRTSKEKNINLKVALAVGKLLTDADKEIKVYYTRKKDVFVTLQKRAQIANNHHADLFISIHTNAVAKGRTVQGTETYTLGLHRTQENLEVAQKENAVILIEEDYHTRYAGFNPNSSESYIMFEFMQDKNMKQSVQLATLIQQQFKGHAHRIDRGVRQAGFLVLHATSMPSVLVELGYISNPTEERYLNTSNGINALSRSISRAVLSYKRAQTGLSGETSLSTTEPIAETTTANPPKQKEITVSQQRSNQPTSPLKKQPSTRSTEKNTDGKIITTEKPVFKIQVLTSSTVLKKNDRKLKGLSPVSYYKEKGIYKYTYGISTDYNEILRLKKKVMVKFKDAFIIAFRGETKMNVQEAIQEFKRNR